jgi:hypothetical protein
MVTISGTWTELHVRSKEVHGIMLRVVREAEEQTNHVPLWRVGGGGVTEQQQGSSVGRNAFG